ncbi:hypothetical protein BH09PAT1_BH09PAT1_1250 [soil metagenome]
MVGNHLGTPPIQKAAKPLESTDHAITDRPGCYHPDHSLYRRRTAIDRRTGGNSCHFLPLNHCHTRLLPGCAVSRELGRARHLRAREELDHSYTVFHICQVQACTTMTEVRESVLCPNWEPNVIYLKYFLYWDHLR